MQNFLPHKLKILLVSFLLLFFSPFFFRRLGVELGKSVVYQEANRGEIPLLYNLYIQGYGMLIFFSFHLNTLPVGLSVKSVF